MTRTALFLLSVFMPFAAVAARAGEPAAGPASVAPDWATLTIQRADNGIYLANPQRAHVVRVVAEPKLEAIKAVDATLAPDHFQVDASRKNEAGIAKVNLHFYPLALKEFPEYRYQATLDLQGPKDAQGHFYVEGRTPDKKHFYKFVPVILSGARQTVAITEAIPQAMDELHLRFDMLTPGVYRFYGAAFGVEPPPTPRVAVKPELIFHAPFDGSPDAVVAGGRAQPLSASGLVYGEGVNGQALRSTREARSRLEYALKGNLIPERGSIAAWYRPDAPMSSEVGDNKSRWRTLLGMQRPGDNALRIGSGAIWFWNWGELLRGDTSDSGDSYITAPQLLEADVWQHVVFTWDEYQTKLYVDGRERTGRRDSYTPLKVRDSGFTYQRERNPAEFFFVGCYDQGEQIDGFIDDLRIYSAPIAPDTIETLVADWRRFDLLLGRHFYAPGAPVKLPLTFRNRSARPVDIEFHILDAAGKQVSHGRTTEKPFSTSPTVSDPSPILTLDPLAPGRYDIKATDGRYTVTDSFWVLRPGNAEVSADGKLKTVPVETIVPKPDMAGGRLLHIGDLAVRKLGNREYLEAGPVRGDRFAVRVRLPDATGPYLVEWDYPDDKKRTCDIIAQSALPTGGEYELQVGYSSGDEYPNSGGMLTQRNLYYPRSDDIVLVFMTARNGAPAAVSEIRVAKIEGGLPSAEVVPAPAVAGWTRNVGIYYEDPAVNYGFGVNATAVPGLETLLDRLTAYMKYSGQNVFAYPVVWYHGRIGDTYNPRNHAKGFMEAFLAKFDAEGLQFVATMNQNTMPVPDGLVTERAIAGGTLHATPVAIHDTGKPNPGQWHDTPPNFNIFHPDTEKLVFDTVDGLLADGASHPSFKGVLLHLTRHCLLWPADIKSGYNDYAVDGFERDTGIKVPVDRKHPMRGKLYAEWLLANARAEWVDWRCRKLAGIYRRLADRVSAKRPDLKLIVNCMIPMSEVGDPRFPNPDFVSVKVREAGLDPKLYADADNIVLEMTDYPADYRWRAERRVSPEAMTHLRTLNMERDFFRLLEGARHPWLHMHDRYWESAIGSTRTDHWSDKPNALLAPWFREQNWRVSTLNPAGVHAMRHYVLPLRYVDLQTITKGGFLIGTYGMEELLTPFIRAFRALPAKVFGDVATGSETVVARKLDHEGVTWFYVVNTSDRPAEASVKVGGKAVDLVGGAEMGGAFALRLAPYQLRSFKLGAVGDVSVQAP